MLFSEEAVNAHKEYLNGLRLRYSIITKSLPTAAGLDIKGIMRIRCDRSMRAECAYLYSSVRLHELFFSSFCEGGEDATHTVVLDGFGSTASLLYELTRLGREEGEGFICLYKVGGKILFLRSRCPEELMIFGPPILCIDLWEHAYFADYGFDRRRYLEAAVHSLDLKKLT